MQSGWGVVRIKGRVKRINIFTGNLGSGKTEIALNFTLKIKGQYSRTALVDLDVLNPYFTSRQIKDILADKGIELVTMPDPVAASGLPVVPPRVRGVISDSGCGVICDVGGDKMGAMVLGQFAPDLAGKEYDFFLVVNPFRPLTRDSRGIALMLAEIEAASRLRATALVSNPNLAGETRKEHVGEGHDIVREAGQILGVPVAFVGVQADLADDVAHQLEDPLLPMRIFMKKPWELNNSYLGAACNNNGKEGR